MTKKRKIGKRTTYKTKVAGGMKIKRVETPKKTKVIVKMPKGKRIKTVRKKK